MAVCTIHFGEKSFATINREAIGSDVERMFAVCLAIEIGLIASGPICSKTTHRPNTGSLKRENVGVYAEAGKPIS